jgi:uncharacterized protein (TIRG00374 family)
LAVKLRGALLGAGNIALRSHAPKWVGDEWLRREIEIVAVADLAHSNLAAAREWLPEARVYEEAEALLDREHLDFCDICTPPDTHRRLIEHAAMRGIHILCEKPLAPSVAEAGHIARAVRGAGVVFRPCHQYHYSPQWQAVRERLPRLGRIRLAEYQVSRVGANPGNPHWSPDWRTDQMVAGGGILVDHGAHILYQLRGVLGDPVSVQAVAARLLDPAYDVEDTALVVLDYGDCLAQLSLTWAARRRAIRFRFVGERGELSGDDQRIEVHAARSEVVEFDDAMSGSSSHADWYTPLLREFSAQVRDGRHDDDPLEEAMQVTQVIERAYESALLGRGLRLVAEPGELESASRGSVASGADDDGWSKTPNPVLETEASAGPGTARAGLARWPQHAMVRVAGLLVLLAVAFLAFRRIHWPEFWHTFRTADPRWLVLAAVLNLGVVALAATRWFALLQPLSRRVRWRDAFESTLVGFATSAVVPARGGEVTRAGMLHRRTAISGAEVVGTIGLDQLLNAAGFMVGLAFLPWLGGVPSWMRPGAALALAVFGLAVTVLVAWWPHRPPARQAADGESRRGLNRMLAGIQQGLRAVRSPRAIGRALAASLAAWMLELVVLAVALRSVAIALPVPAIVVVLLGINVMLAMPVTPGNLGTLEVGATLALLGFGVAREKALAFAICYHALQSIPLIALGLGVAVGEGLRTRSEAGPTPVNRSRASG